MFSSSTNYPSDKKGFRTRDEEKNVDMAIPSCQGKEARAVAGAGKNVNC